MNLKSPGEKLVDAFLYTIIGIVLLMVMYPFVHVLSVSFSDRGEALRYGFHFYPRSFSLEAYEQVFRSRNIGIGYRNTLFRMIAGTAASLAVTVLAAYPLSRPYFPYKRAFTLLILFTMLFDGGIIPTYLLLRDLGLINTRGVYIVLHMASAFHVLVMMSFFRTIPKELEESARIDGAGELRTLMRIMLPLTVPVLVTLALWNLVMHMNQFSDNLLYVTDRAKFVLQYVLQEILIQDRQDSFASLTMTAEPPAPESLKMASIMVAITPLLVIYPFLLKYFEKGTMVGSVKG